MIYGDPDYGVGINYAGKKYTQRWNEYIDWYVELATECMRVLRKDGNLFFINYPRQNSYLRVRCLDELAYEVFDYVWVYPTNVGHTPRRFTDRSSFGLACGQEQEKRVLQRASCIAVQEPGRPPHKGPHC